MPYSGDPSASLADAVRFWCDDTTTTPLLSDAEIAYLTVAFADSTNSNPLRLAAACCTRIMAKYAGEVSISQDGVSYSGDQLQQKYSTLRESLLTEARGMERAGVLPEAGGLFVNDPRDETVLPTSFAIGMLDNPEADDQPYVGSDGDIPLIEP